MTEMRFYNGFTEAEMANAYGLQKLGIEKVQAVLHPRGPGRRRRAQGADAQHG